MYDYPSPYWDGVSPEARDLIDRLLVLDPSRRLSAADLLEHPWTKVRPAAGRRAPVPHRHPLSPPSAQGRAPDTALKSVQQQLKRFNARRKFRVRSSLHPPAAIGMSSLVAIPMFRPHARLPVAPPGGHFGG